MTMHDVMDARYMLDNNGDGEYVCAHACGGHDKN